MGPGLRQAYASCKEGSGGPGDGPGQWALTPGSPQILAALPVDWRGPHLLACACLRLVFIPLFILCVYPSGAPALRHPAWPCVFSLLMGISNGYFGSVPMILAAGKVSPKQRELAGEAPLGLPGGQLGSPPPSTVLGAGETVVIKQ